MAEMEGITAIPVFNFGAPPMDYLTETQYTLVTICVDGSGSVDPFVDDIEATLATALKAAAKSAYAASVLVRVLRFDSSVTEVSPFKAVGEYSQIDLGYKGGNTCLIDAVANAAASTLSYAQQLQDNDYLANGLIIIITDGQDNNSTLSEATVARTLKEAVTGEKLESLQTVLVGVNAAQFQQYLENFQRKVGIGKYIDIKDATPESLAKLGGLISQSISSTSQALGTGGPSQVALTI